MITPQEIKEKTFEKTLIGGYDMGAVDNFIDQLSGEITSLSKENAVLKGKLKVLVEKIEEYRQTEDSMRLALLSAQKMSIQIENAAKAKAEAMLQEARATSEALLQDARAQSDALVGDARAQAATEQDRLSAARAASTKYISRLKAVCQKQMDFYTTLETAGLVDGEAEQTPQPAVDETVKTIEDSVARAVDEEPVPQQELDFGSDLPSGDEGEPTKLYNIGDVLSGAGKTGGVPKFSADDLKFGDDY